VQQSLVHRLLHLRAALRLRAVAHAGGRHQLARRKRRWVCSHERDARRDRSIGVTEGGWERARERGRPGRREGRGRERGRPGRRGSEQGAEGGLGSRGDGARCG
jgi:hypothetical protein